MRGRRRLYARLDAELGEDPRHVHAGGLLGDEERLADPAVRVTLGHQGQDGELERFLVGAAPVREPERVLATVLFTDIVDSTQRSAELGDRRWRDLMARHEAIVRDRLARFRGKEVMTLGDGFMSTEDRGTHDLKGVADDWHLYALAAA
jgi:class 3 adenylate cyclase